MTTKQTNKKTDNAESFNADEFEQIVFHRNYDPKFYPREIILYTDVPLSTIKVLVEKGYLDPDDEIVCGVTAQVFIDFVEKHDPEKWTFIGHVASPTRQGRRITIEGIKSKGKLSKQDLIDFLLKFRMVDELYVEEGFVYCWYN